MRYNNFCSYYLTLTVTFFRLSSNLMRLGKKYGVFDGWGTCLLLFRWPLHCFCLTIEKEYYIISYHISLQKGHILDCLKKIKIKGKPGKVK